jgi:hypothetical protein
MAGADLQSTLAAFGAPKQAGMTPFGQIAQIGQVKSYDATGPGGSATYTPEGVQSSGPGNDLYSMLSQLAGSSATGGAQGQDVSQILSSLLQNGGNTPQSDQANSLFSNFATQAGNYNPDTSTNNMLQRLNAIAQPADQNAASTLANRLFSKGRLGGQDTTAGRAFGELAKQQDLAQQQRYLTAFSASGQEADRLTNFANTFGQLGSTLRGGNVTDTAKIAALPSAIQGQNIQNAGGAITAGNSALDPIYKQLDVLFQGLNISADQKAALSKAFADKLAANKASGSGASPVAQMVGQGIGTAVGAYFGGPAGAKAGGEAGSSLGGIFSRNH